MGRNDKVLHTIVLQCTRLKSLEFTATSRSKRASMADEQSLSPTTLPYRPNVGVALFNGAGLVFAGEAVNAGPEVVRAGFEWQMPQGGIDPDEDIEAAARRELWEETGISDVAVLAITEDWWPYDFPPYDGPPHKLSAFRGQTQRWVAFRFEGDESAIDLTRPPPGCVVEFTAWDWVPLSWLAGHVMPHKQESYRRVVEAFRDFAAPER